MSQFALTDRFAIDDGAKVRYTEDGYMTAAPRVARTGIQLYRGKEVGKPELDIVRIYRSADEVFNADSLHSFGHRPVTDDHPPVNVTAENWKDYAKGQLGGEVARDGQFIRVPMCMMDAATIGKFKGGKVELSVGYTCDIDWTAGEFEGQSYDGFQKDIRANHVALVKAARGGKDLRVGDGTGVAPTQSAFIDGLRAIIKGDVDKSESLAGVNGYLADASKKQYPFMLSGKVHLMSLRACKADAIAKGDGDILAAVDSMLSLIDDTTAVEDGNKERETMTKMITVDGVSVEVMNDQAAQIIQKALTSATDAFNFEKKKKEEAEEEVKKKKDALDAAIASHATVITTKDAEIATLKTQVADNVMTPAKLDGLVKDRAVTAGKARALLGDKLMVDGKTDHEIRKQVVDLKLGEQAKAWSEDQVKISFDTLTADVKAIDGTVSGVMDTARAFSAPAGTVQMQNDALYTKRDKALQEAWKGPAASA